MAEMAEQAAKAVRAQLVGVDLITPDGTAPLAEVGGVVNEVNTTPALHHHYDPSERTHPAVAVCLLRSLLRSRGRGHVSEAA